jgi:hypothetical protein
MGWTTKSKVSENYASNSSRANSQATAAGSKFVSDHLTVNFRDLLDAFMWVSGDAAFSPEAYISRESGKIYWKGFDDSSLEEELPDDIDDPDLYVPVPSKNDLDLGRRLVFRFAEEHLGDACELVYGFFRSRGAYARFKDLLDRKGQLDHWHDYETKAVEAALREWCEDNDLRIADTPDRPGPTQS